MTHTPAPASAARPPAPVWRRALPPLLASTLVGVLGYALLRPAPHPAATGSLTGPLVGRAAPPFTLSSLEGPQVSLADFQGRPVVLNFWASWCGPCRAEAPLFSQLSAQRQDKVQVIGILFQETSDQNARSFIQEFKLKYPNLKDPGLETGIKYAVSGIPVTVFIDAGGAVRHLDQGGLTPERLNVGLDKIGVPRL